MYIPDMAAHQKAKEKLSITTEQAVRLELADAIASFEKTFPLLFDSLDYLLRQKPLFDPDPRYRQAYDEYDVVFCNTCCQTSIEPEIGDCEGCGKDVCPHCCGITYGWHELCRRECDGEVNPILDRLAFALGLQQPVDLLLYCPSCGNQHIDAPDAARGWVNPPHRSHECQFCNGPNGKPFVWRPSDRHTNGIAAIKTKGKLDGDLRPKLTIVSSERSK